LRAGAIPATNLSRLELDLHHARIGAFVEDGERELVIGLVEFVPGN
jgi:hypothetical protein